MRVTPPEFILPAIRKFDQAIYTQFEAITGQQLYPHTRKRIGLPVKWGGCGIPMAEDLALPSYLGSLIHSIKLQAAILGKPVFDAECEELGFTREDFDQNHVTMESILERSVKKLVDKFISDNSLEGDAITISALRSNPKPQYALSTLLFDKTRSDLLSALKTPGLLKVEHDINIEYTSLVATSSDKSDSCGAFLRTLPMDGFTIPSNLFRIAICHYLGLPVFHLPINDRIHLKCSECLDHRRGASCLDNHGIHALACQMGGDLNTRHNAIRDLLFTLCRNLGFSVGKEWPGLIEGSKARPGDLIIRGGAASGNKDLAIDVSIVSIPIANQHFSPEAIMENAAVAKITKYKNKLIAANTVFTTFIMNTYGGFHSSTSSIINRLAHSWAARYHCSFGIAKDQIITKLSMCLRKNLAQQIEHRIPENLRQQFNNAPAVINDVYGIG